jgi:hypothetical protein
MVRRAYRENFERHRRSLEETCRVLGTELHPFVTDRPVIDALTRLVRQRAVR